RKEVTVELGRADDPGTVPVDPVRIHQVLDNLIGNAVKFSPAGARVRVELRHADGSTEVAVSDSGPGIPEAEQGALFTFYGRTSVQPTAGEGSTGLGLAIARRIVEEHGGRIGVVSAPGTGSTFTFVLP